ncbi:hypothetical protein LTS12_029757 [Elasticomyces elasticus]|nr:hypothetical protein LTS12_029757 [Elasticomyces elasticus]
MRDEQFRASMRQTYSRVNPDKWADHDTQRLLWGWDAESFAWKAWRDLCKDNSRMANL